MSDTTDRGADNTLAMNMISEMEDGTMFRCLVHIFKRKGWLLDDMLTTDANGIIRSGKAYRGMMVADGFRYHHADIVGRSLLVELYPNAWTAVLFGSMNVTYTDGLLHVIVSDANVVQALGLTTGNAVSLMASLFDQTVRS